MNQELAPRFTIPDILRIKHECLRYMEMIDTTEQTLRGFFEQIHGHQPYDIRWNFRVFGEDRAEKYVDQTCWRYLARLFELEKYMLCTEYERMQKDIENFNFPQFTQENAEGWLNGLKALIHENVKTLIKKVYSNVVNGTYYTGSGYSSREKKKRNNNGIDKHFIIQTGDYSRIFGYCYYSGQPTITDDLEKVCYLLNGETLPKSTLKSIMYADKVDNASNEYLKVQLCKNGNTHYWIEDETREKLNLYGPEGHEIGEDIRIKVFDKRF
jgi:hypothetical protein